MCSSNSLLECSAFFRSSNLSAIEGRDSVADPGYIGGAGSGFLCMNRLKNIVSIYYVPANLCNQSNIFSHDVVMNNKCIFLHFNISMISLTPGRLNSSSLHRNVNTHKRALSIGISVNVVSLVNPY